MSVDSESLIPAVLNDVANGRELLVQEVLGSGGFAKCFRVTDRTTSQSFAAKIVSKQLIKQDSVLRKLRTEIQIHSQLRHPNVVAFEGYFEDSANHYIILELCTNNTLLELIQRKKVLAERHAKRLVLDVVEGLQYIHSQHVIHRDIKLGNLFLDEKFSVKIGDFGLATRMSTDPAERKKTMCGTPNYIAPEIIAKQGYSYEVDIWSLGIALYTILVGRPPFFSENKNSNELCRMILNDPVKFPDSLSQDAENLISSLLRKNPQERPSLNAIKNHPFFASCYKMPPMQASNSEKENVENLAATSVRAADMANALLPSSSLVLSVLRKLNLYLEKRHFSQVETRTSFISKSSLPTHVTKFFDYSKKYGIFYELSNGSVGCFFNDHSCLLFTGGFYWYLARARNSTSKYESLTFATSQIPTQLLKKFEIFTHVTQKYLTMQPVISFSRAPRGTESEARNGVLPANLEGVEIILKVLHLPNGVVLRSKERLIQALMGNCVYLFIDELNWITVIKDSIVSFNGPFNTFPHTDADTQNFQQIRNSILSHG